MTVDRSPANATAPNKLPSPVAGTSPTPTAIHLSFAKYGRVGKSTWLKLLIEYMAREQKQHIIVDTDKETPNVARAYTPELVGLWAGDRVVTGEPSLDDLLFTDDLQPQLSTSQEQINALLAEQILFSDDNRTEYLTRNIVSLSKFGRDILVNLPANVYSPVCDFITNNQLDRAPKIKLFNWWVSNGAEESLDLFVATQAKFPEAKHILVLNQGNFQYVYDWKRFRLSKPISDLYARGRIKIVRMPFLSVEPSFWQSQEFVPYRDIIRDGAIDEFVRAAIETWMNKAFDAIAQTTWL